MNRTITKSILLIVVAIFIANQYYSCKKTDLVREVMVKTIGVTGIAISNATLSGEIVDLGEGNITSYGFCYSTSDNPTIADEKEIVSNNLQIGTYEAPVAGLDQNTTYYFRAFAEEGSGGTVSYGGAMSFTTLQGEINLPTVVTESVYNVTENSASISGNVTDDGGGTISQKGFCLSPQSNPTIDDIISDNGAGTGQYSHSFLGLLTNTQYYVKAYAQNSEGIAYGDEMTFITEEGGGPLYEWLNYDSGENHDGIGLNEGGDFDVAIKFEPSQLQNYNGWKITKFRFFPLSGFPTTYSFEIYTGPYGTILDHFQDILTVTPNEWNEVILDDLYIIDASQNLYPGYWVQEQAMGEYPAGTDQGPAVMGSGDLISVGGEPWQALSILDPSLDYNWNLQIYITNASGEEKLLNPGPPVDPHKKTGSSIFPEVSSSNQSNR